MSGNEKRENVFNTLLQWLSIKQKVVLLVLITSIATATVFVAVFSFQEAQSSYNENIQDKKNLMNVVYLMLENYNEQVKAGLISKEEAQVRVKKIIRNLRYMEGTGYFFVIDYNYIFIVHPLLPNIEGKNINWFKAPKSNQSLIREIVDKARKHPNGVIHYYLWPETSENINLTNIASQPNLKKKLTYIMPYEEWSWVLCTGRYYENIDKDLLLELVLSTLIGSLFVILLIFIINKTFVKSIVKPIQAISETSLRLAEGELNVYIPEDTHKTEIGELNRSFKKFVDQTKELMDTVEKQTQKLKEYVSKLENYNLMLLEANSHKTKFLSNMSHELRTPLNAILGFSQLLIARQYGEINEAQKESIETIYNSGRHLLDLVNDLLDISKIDSGTMSLHPEPSDVSSFVDNVLSMMRSQFKKKNIETSVKVDETIGLVYVDIRKCRQIMLNLLSNAFKYTPDGGKIAVDVTKASEEFLQIEVKDTGIGLEEESLAKIFQEFYQVDKTLQKDMQGTGIGLALTKKLIELHGGEIFVESSPGKGSVFTFTLRTLESLYNEINCSTERKDGKTQLGRKKTIICYEGNTVNKIVLEDVFSKNGYNPIIVESGTELVSKSLLNSPDIIILDSRMPKMSGKEAFYKLKDSEELNNTLFIAIVSNGKEKRDLNEGAYSIDFFLEKPLEISALRKLLHDITSQQRMS